MIRLAVFCALLVAAAVTPAVDATPITLRAAFYYPWYPEHWAEGSHYVSGMGQYNSQSPSVVSGHISQMQIGKIDAGISSWWGPGDDTDLAVPVMLNAALGTTFKWALYYELDWNGQRSQNEVKQDLAYIKSRYASDSSYLRVNGKPVVFVYTPGGSCATANKWKNANQSQGFYLSMTDVPNWWANCQTAVDSWHAYKPALRGAPVNVGSTLYAVSLSAGFWQSAEAAPRLSRDFAEFTAYLQAYNAYAFPWQLFYFNEFVEGTVIEASNARCLEWLCLDYMNVLGANPAP